MTGSRAMARPTAARDGASNSDYLVGVISDTHGHLRREGLHVFEKVDLIIHAGDIGRPEILEALHAVAPVYAVRGNMDTGSWARQLPETQVVEVGDALLYVIHDAHHMDLDPEAAGFSAVICGHTHRPLIDRHGDILFLNPGTAGPFRSPLTVALLRVRGKSLHAELRELTP
ncbi:MAG: metallophosphoesterase family protein [Thermodesulfobacteriota bacterium]|nr:metallophosphoesterase family protein [Thermodesulfobacteriota bacterium]